MDDGDIGFGIHHHQGDEDTMVVPSLRRLFEDYTVLADLVDNLLSECWSALGVVLVFIGFSRKPVIIEIQSRNIFIEDGKLAFLPMGRYYDQTFRIWEEFAQLAEVFQHPWVFSRM